MRSKEQIKADNLAILPSLVEQGATYWQGIEKWIEQSATQADALSYLEFPTLVVSERIPTAEEVEYGCEYYEDCPCCNCGEDVAKVITYSRKRWSRSGKCLTTETFTNYVCVAH